MEVKIVLILNPVLPAQSIRAFSQNATGTENVRQEETDVPSSADCNEQPGSGINNDEPVATPAPPDAPHEESENPRALDQVSGTESSSDGEDRSTSPSDEEISPTASPYAEATVAPEIPLEPYTTSCEFEVTWSNINEDMIQTKLEILAVDTMKHVPPNIKYQVCARERVQKAGMTLAERDTIPLGEIGSSSTIWEAPEGHLRRLMDPLVDITLLMIRHAITNLVRSFIYKSTHGEAFNSIPEGTVDVLKSAAKDAIKAGARDAFVKAAVTDGLKEVGKSASKHAVKSLGAVKSAGMAHGVKLTLGGKAGAAHGVSRAAAAGSIIGGSVFAVIETGFAIYDVVQNDKKIEKKVEAGELSPEEAANSKSTFKKKRPIQGVGSVVGSTVGAVMGAALGPVGMFTGGAAGSYFGGVLGKGLADELIPETPENAEEKEAGAIGGQEVLQDQLNVEAIEAGDTENRERQDEESKAVETQLKEKAEDEQDTKNEEIEKNFSSFFNFLHALFSVESSATGKEEENLANDQIDPSASSPQENDDSKEKMESNHEESFTESLSTFWGSMFGGKRDKAKRLNENENSENEVKSMNVCISEHDGIWMNAKTNGTDDSETKVEEKEEIGDVNGDESANDIEDESANDIEDESANDTEDEKLSMCDLEGERDTPNTNETEKPEGGLWENIRNRENEKENEEESGICESENKKNDEIENKSMSETQRREFEREVNEYKEPWDQVGETGYTEDDENNSTELVLNPTQNVVWYVGNDENEVGKENDTEDWDFDWNASWDEEIAAAVLGKQDKDEGSLMQTGSSDGNNNDRNGTDVYEDDYAKNEVLNEDYDEPGDYNGNNDMMFVKSDESNRDNNMRLSLDGNSDGMVINSDGMVINSDGMLINSDGMLINSDRSDDDSDQGVKSTLCSVNDNTGDADELEGSSDSVLANNDRCHEVIITIENEVIENDGSGKTSLTSPVGHGYVHETDSNENECERTTELTSQVSTCNSKDTHNMEANAENNQMIAAHVRVN